MCVRPVREAAQMTSRRPICRKRLDLMSTMLLIERRVVLLLAHRRSQVLGADSIQRVVLPRHALNGVVVNRTDVTRIETTMIHVRLAVVMDRRCALHLTTKVRRALMHLVLSATEIPNVSATEATASHVAATTHVAATAMTATAHVAATAMATTSTTSSVAVAIRHTLKTEQRGANDQTGGKSH